MSWTQANEVARRLIRIAQTHANYGFLNRLAIDIITRQLFVADGPIATRDQCKHFLQEHFPSATLTNTFAAIDLGSVRESQRESNVVNYRAVVSALNIPAGFAGPKRGRRPHPDNISLCILLAHRALTRAGCTRPGGAVADALKQTRFVAAQYATPVHVRSRIKSVTMSDTELRWYLYDVWCASYWKVQNPDAPIPMGFRFKRCDC